MAEEVKDPSRRIPRAMILTILVGGVSALFSFADNLIQLVNIVGSLFYGTILGIFLVAFFLKGIGARAVFLAGLITQGATILHFVLDKYDVLATPDAHGVMHDPIEVAFLWYNLLAPALLIALAFVFQGSRVRHTA